MAKNGSNESADKPKDNNSWKDAANWLGPLYGFCIAIVTGAIVYALHSWPLKDAGSALGVAFLVACGVFLVGALLAAAHRSRGSTSAQSDQAAEAIKDTPYWLDRLYALLLAGAVAIFFYAIHFGSFTLFVSAFSVGLLGACGALLAGVLLGVLYGMPVDKPNGGSAKDSASDQNDDENDKDNSKDAKKKNSKAQTSDDGPAPSSPFRPSTRLQEIADWLTKIIIGLGLAEIGKIPGKLWQLAHFLGHALGDSPTGDAVALTLLVAYFTAGFLIGFIWADVYFPGILAQTYYKLNILKQRVKKLENYVENFDLNALRLSEQWLSRYPGDESAEDKSAEKKVEGEISNAIEHASPTARYQAFYQAYEHDRPDWTRAQRMDRRVAIYQALVDQDKQKVFHRNRGQLGIALATRTDSTKDPSPAALDQAIEQLHTAISIRDKNGDTGWGNYEFYVAYSLIRHPQKSKDVASILKYLQAARQANSLLKMRLQEIRKKTADVRQTTELLEKELLKPEGAKSAAAPKGAAKDFPKDPHDEYTIEDFVLVHHWFVEKARLHPEHSETLKAEAPYWDPEKS